MKRKLDTEDIEQNKKIKIDGAPEFIGIIFDTAVRYHIFEYLGRNDLSNLESTSTSNRNLFLKEYSALFSNFIQILEIDAPKFEIDDSENLLESFKTLTTTNNITRIFLEDILKKYKIKNPETEQIKGILLYFFSKLSISIHFKHFEINLGENRYKFIKTFPFHFTNCTFTQSNGLYKEFNPSDYPGAKFDGINESGGKELYDMSEEECYRKGLEPYYLTDNYQIDGPDYQDLWKYLEKCWDHVVEKMEVKDENEKKTKKISELENINNKLKEEIKIQEETYQKEIKSLQKTIQNLTNK